MSEKSVIDWRITDRLRMSNPAATVENEAGQRLYREDQDPAAVVGLLISGRF